MSSYLAFLLLGLGAGAVYAALGLGLVVTYKGTSVVNFAQGAMAMWGAYTFDELRTTGDLLLPVVGVPHRVDLGEHVAFAPALAVAVVASAVLGLLAHVLVFRPLRHAPALARVVASVGLMVVMQGLVVLRFQSEPRAVAAILPREPVELLGASLPRDRLWLAGIVVLIAAGLWAWFRYARAGLAIRAAAEDEQVASLTGLSPERLAATTWVLSGALTGLMVVLASPVTGLNPLNYTLYVVPGLAVALVGRLSSVAVTCAAGLGLGALQSETLFLTGKSWWPDWAAAGIADAVPFVVVIVALFLVGASLPARGAAGPERLPAVRRARPHPATVAALVTGAVAALALTDGSYRFGIITSMIAAIVALSLVVLTGLVGQISLAQAAFAGTAGFALSKLADGAGIPFPISPVLAALAATVIGVAVGLPALRIRGAQLAVVTLAAGLAIERFVFRNPQFTPQGGNPIPDPSIFGLDLGIREGSDITRLPFGILTLVVLTAVALAVSNLIRSGTGARFLAVRSNERAAASVGIDVSATKLIAFALASFMAGVGGTLIGYSRGQLSAESFGAFVGISYLAFAYLGGITSVGGALVAGTFAPLGIGYIVLDRNLGLGEHYLLLSGVALIATAVFNPNGIAGTVTDTVARARAALGRAEVGTAGG